MAHSFYELTPEQVTAWFADRGHPPYRARQVMTGVYRRGVSDFAQMTDLPAALRAELAREFDLRPVTPDRVVETSDTTKLLLSLPAGGQVECVRIAMDGAFTACVSSQIGCVVNCAFCATGHGGYERSLTPGEILAQVLAINRLGPGVRNVVFMGMGEPFHNYANVVSAVRRMVSPDLLALSPRRITVSTAGVVPAIHRYAEEGLATELAVSLNASTDEQRRQLMPGVARYPLAQLMEACQHFSAAHHGRPVTFAYVLIEGVNDTFDDAERLARLLKHQPHHLNLIPLNRVTHSALRAPAYPRLRAFLQACRRHKLNVSLRHSKGEDIEAACGQLRAGRAGPAVPTNEKAARSQRSG